VGSVRLRIVEGYIFYPSTPGCKRLKPVVFKCHWFDPEEKRETRDIGLVEIQQSFVYAGDDVYIVAQQATQVYYLSYPCKTDKRLQGWDVVYKVSAHGSTCPKQLRLQHISKYTRGRVLPRRWATRGFCDRLNRSIRNNGSRR
jgi:hypothetical protein